MITLFWKHEELLPICPKDAAPFGSNLLLLDSPSTPEARQQSELSFILSDSILAFKRENIHLSIAAHSL